MVLESLFSAQQVERKPLDMFMLGSLITIIATVLTYKIFFEMQGMVIIFLLTMGMLPLMVSLMKYEEQKDEKELKRSYAKENLFLRHEDILKDYFCFFFGVTLTFAVMLYFLPEDVATTLFGSQMVKIAAIRGGVTLSDSFFIIVMNNVEVALVCFIFSFFFGCGAIFILGWNASILGIVVGQGAKQLAGAHYIPVVLLSFMPHGIPEIFAYFLAGLAGGIISVAVVRHPIGSKEFTFVFKDALMLMGAAVFFIVLAGYIEVLF